MTSIALFNAPLELLRKRLVSSTQPHYVIYDKLDKVIHRGPWTKQECIEWMAMARSVMPRPQGVDDVWDIRRLKK